ncbi:ATP-dependent Clp protease proteolytic subunit [Amycolatopsis jiangsuensis]|uniref:ATP-dependent Clp protease proteolytic subunit n=1 Tax=Amycolatopsis jiangsuensis TaxID=1181879 RepID=A0A840IZY2_9PSEU|nr:ATP-dependent Clp protease proteolytic subunit [Amycolatopsis jiangsuensis]MBB4688226.1 ATP-dependent Clp protease protease subunit [Amycolatopsis jiangsuensis]
MSGKASLYSQALHKLMSDMLEDRTIVISGELDRSVSTVVVSQLLLLNATDPHAAIRLYIDSAAGSLPSGFAICDTIDWITPEVSTWAIGAVGSVATLVLCSGAAGKRYALPGTDIVLRHPARDEGAEPITPPAATYHRWIGEMTHLLAERTGKHPNTISSDLRSRHHLAPTDSVAYGLVDHVATRGKFAPQGN